MRPFPENTGSPPRVYTVLGLWYLGAILPVRYGSDLTTSRAPGQGAGELCPWRRPPPGTAE